MNDELKACQCGETEMLRVDLKEGCVYCDSCGLRGGDFEGGTYEDIVEKWNDRPLEDALCAERDMLKAQLKDAKKNSADWQSEYEIFAKAWLREIGGKTLPKTHLIDALVLTTREIIKERDLLKKKQEMAMDMIAILREHIEAFYPNGGKFELDIIDNNLAAIAALDKKGK